MTRRGQHGRGLGSKRNLSPGALVFRRPWTSPFLGSWERSWELQIPGLCCQRVNSLVPENWKAPDLSPLGGGIAGRPEPPTYLANLSSEKLAWAEVYCLINLITLVHLVARGKIIPFRFDPILVFVVITMENRPLAPQQPAWMGGDLRQACQAESLMHLQERATHPPSQP